MSKLKLNFFLKLFLVIASIIVPVNQVIAESDSSSGDYSPISFFRTSPRLVGSNTSFNSVGAWSRYNFRIEVPSSAETNLAKIVINQQQNLEVIDIYPDESKVVLLDDRGETPIEHDIQFTIDDRENTSVITVNLIDPVPAGSKIKVALRAKNPYSSGVYQFDVEVFPQGDNPRSLRLGIARFNFYNNYGGY